MVGNPFVHQDLPHLVQFVDPVSIRERFITFFCEAYPGYSVVDCGIEKVSFRPGKHCSALFRLALLDMSGQPVEQWFLAKMYKMGKGWPRYEKARTKPYRATWEWEPVSYWSDWDTILWAFPYDAHLPQLAELLQPARVANLVQQHRADLGLSAGSILDGVVCQRVKYVPGKRCVLRFQLELCAADGEKRPFSFYSKTFADAQSRYVYNTLCTVQDSLQARAGAFDIPPLLGHLDKLHTYWQADWGGQPMARLYQQTDWPELLPAIAQGLAVFHLSDIPNLRPARYLNEIVSEVVGDTDWIADFVPSIGARAEALSQRIAALEPLLVASRAETAVPIHGAFRMSQLLYENGRIAMVDLDAVALGDPHYDVAEFMASTLYQYFHRNLPLQPLMQLATQFQQQYATCVPWPLDSRLLAWYIAASLLGKLRGSFKRIQFAAIHKAEDLFWLVEHYLDTITQAETAVLQPSP